MKLGVALAGGAFKGICHLGALEVLEKNGIKIDMVSDCSMGAVVGGLYAAGVPVEKLKEELKDLKRGRLMDFYPKALRNMGLMSGDKIVRYLKGLCGDVLIEDLKTPFVATAVDIVTGKTVYIDKGPLLDAIRASISIPGLFAAVKKDDMLLVDGGVKERIPVSILKEKGMDKTLAINTSTDPGVMRPKNMVMMLSRAFDLMDWESCRRGCFCEADYTVPMERGCEIVYYKPSEAVKAYEMGVEAMTAHLERAKAALGL